MDKEEEEEEAAAVNMTGSPLKRIFRMQNILPQNFFEETYEGCRTISSQRHAPRPPLQVHAKITRHNKVGRGHVTEHEMANTVLI